MLSRRASSRQSKHVTHWTSLNQSWSFLTPRKTLQPKLRASRRAFRPSSASGLWLSTPKSPATLTLPAILALWIRHSESRRSSLVSHTPLLSPTLAAWWPTTFGGDVSQSSRWKNGRRSWPSPITSRSWGDPQEEDPQCQRHSDCIQSTKPMKQSYNRPWPRRNTLRYQSLEDKS